METMGDTVGTWLAGPGMGVMLQGLLAILAPIIILDFGVSMIRKAVSG